MVQDFLEERKRMVTHQLRVRGISDRRILEAFESIPRHLFVPADEREWSYEDHPLPIGFYQTISQPYIVAYMTQLLDLIGTERVLEVGTGSGYQAAILAEVVKTVFTIEIIEGLAQKARDRLANLGYRNVHVRVGDGYKGWPEHAPFDAIMVTASAGKIPQPLLNQLAEGGRLIMPVGSSRHSQELTLVTKKDGRFQTSILAQVIFVRMTGEVEGKGRPDP